MTYILPLRMDDESAGSRASGLGSRPSTEIPCLECHSNRSLRMRKIPRRHGHFVYGIIQSGLTCAVAAGIACFPFSAEGTFTRHWLQSWILAWIMMLPVVLLAAPAIRILTHLLTQEE